VPITLSTALPDDDDDDVKTNKQTPMVMMNQ
jgi:hypothetical protein